MMLDKNRFTIKVLNYRNASLITFFLIVLGDNIPNKQVNSNYIIHHIIKNYKKNKYAYY